MGTRSVILVTGKRYNSPQSYRLYKHWDGYPSENLEIIRAAIERAEILRLNAARDSIEPESLAGCIIGESTSAHGIGAKVEAQFSAEFSPEQFGNQGDLEWLYTIDTEARAVQVFESYPGESPQEAFRRGPVDPVKFAYRVRREHLNQTKHEIETAVKFMKNIGFKVN